MDIALIGGHGKVALLAEPLLTGAGAGVDAIIRDAAQAPDVEATGARAVVADIEHLDADGWDALLRGHDAVVWAAGAGGGDPSRTRAVDRDAAIASMEAAARVGARRYVMVSYFGAGPDHGVPEDDAFFPYAQAKSDADAHLASTALDWTILRPSRLTDEASGGGVEADARAAASVSRATVAEVVAAAVVRDDLGGAIVPFNDGGTPVGVALDAVSQARAGTR